MQKYTEKYSGIGRIPDAERMQIIAALDADTSIGTPICLPAVNMVGVEVVAAVIKNMFKSDATLSLVLLGAVRNQEDWWCFDTPLAYENDDRPHRLNVTYCSKSRGPKPRKHFEKQVIELLADAVQTDRHFTHFDFDWSCWNVDDDGYHRFSNDNDQHAYTIGQALQKAPRLSQLTLEGPKLCRVAKQLGLSAEYKTSTNTEILEEMWRPWREDMLLMFAMSILPDDMLQLIIKAYWLRVPL